MPRAPAGAASAAAAIAGGARAGQQFRWSRRDGREQAGAGLAGHRMGVMGLRELIDGLFGRRSASDAALTADRARQRQMRGQETAQTEQEQGAMRQRMEADMDDQRARRATPSEPEG